MKIKNFGAPKPSSCKFQLQREKYEEKANQEKRRVKKKEKKVFWFFVDGMLIKGKRRIKNFLTYRYRYLNRF